MGVGTEGYVKTIENRSQKRCLQPLEMAVRCLAIKKGMW